MSRRELLALLALTSGMHLMAPPTEALESRIFQIGAQRSAPKFFDTGEPKDQTLRALSYNSNCLREKNNAKRLKSIHALFAYFRTPGPCRNCAQ